MADTYQLSNASLDTLFAAIQADGRRILAPTDRDGRSELNPVTSPAQVAKDYIQTTLSGKGTVFPKVEKLLSYTTQPGQVDLQDAVPNAAPTVLFGVRPCEAAGFQALDAVFNWDYRDTFFNARMDKLAVIGVSCTRKDEACFCTSVGGGPGSTKGSDILLTPTADGFLAEVLTGKGKALMALAPEAFQPGNGVDKAALLADVPQAFDQPALTAKLPALFDTPPVGRPGPALRGLRRLRLRVPHLRVLRHPGGGGPQSRAPAAGLGLLRLPPCSPCTPPATIPGRPRAQRWRQRVYHKFSYYPERYGMLGCVGCGKCTRACPVDMNLQEHLVEASKA